MPDRRLPTGSGGAQPGRKSEVQAHAQRATLARSFALLYICGAALVVASLLAPGGQPPQTIGMATATGIAAAAAAALLLIGARPLPRRFAALLPSLGTALITVVVLSAEPATAPAYAVLYTWAVLAGFYFFGLRTALVQLVLAICALSLALAIGGSGDAAVYWVVVTGTLLATGWLVALVRRHSEEVAAHLRAEAISDALTALLNRRGFEERMDEELERARRGGQPLSLLVADLDGLKELNDRDGHAAGDAALCRFAAVLTDAKRRLDAAARVGGDEFALVLPQTRPEGAHEMAQRLRAVLARTGGNNRPLTASFGAATFPDDGSTAAELLAAADRALYASKTERAKQSA